MSMSRKSLRVDCATCAESPGSRTPDDSDTPGALKHSQL